MSVARFVLLATLFAIAPIASAVEPQPRIAIIIDDLGYDLAAGRRAIALPGPLAVAILPATPRGPLLAETAHASGKEVLLHLPLQAVDGQDPAGAADQITLDTGRSAFASAFAAAIDSVPGAIGVSNHRGSLLTRHPGHMQWLMEEIDARDGLFFIDSYTTHHSVALRIAAETGVVAARRDVFIDHDRRPAELAREFERLKTIARQRGVAVGIGHPYPETLDFLEQALPRLATEGFELISISERLGMAPLPRLRQAARPDPVERTRTTRF